MSDVVFKKVDYTLKKLVEDIDIGEIGLPDIQRPFVQPSSKVRDLFDSMYRGYPIGYFYFGRMASPVSIKSQELAKSKKPLVC